MYNSEKFLSEAINSILNQTIGDFEFIIIDDASTDSSLSIVESFHDPRIKLIKKPINTGYTESLNMGLAISQGKYIARMDSDDISRNDRFQVQLNCFKEYSDLVLCGSWYKILGTNNIIKLPVSYDDIKISMLTFCPFAHPTVMLNSELFRIKNLSYDSSMEPAEDYDLWEKIIFNNKAINIDLPLLEYRLHDKQVSSKFSQLQICNASKIRRKIIDRIDEKVEAKFPEYRLDAVVGIDVAYYSYDDLITNIRALEYLKKQNKLSKIFNNILLNDKFNLVQHNLIISFMNSIRDKPTLMLKCFVVDIGIFYKFFFNKLIRKVYSYF